MIYLKFPTIKVKSRWFFTYILIIAESFDNRTSDDIGEGEAAKPPTKSDQSGDLNYLQKYINIFIIYEIISLGIKSVHCQL